MPRRLSFDSARVAVDYARAHPHESKQRTAGLVNSLRMPEGRDALAQHFPNMATRWARGASPSDPAPYTPEDIRAHLESQPSAQAGHPILAGLPGRQAPSLSSRTTSTMSGLARDFSHQELLSAVIEQYNPQDRSGPPLPSGQSVRTQDALTDETSQPSGYSAVSESGQASSGSGVIRSAPRRARKRPLASNSQPGTFPLNEMDGITWHKGRWRLEARRPTDQTSITKIFQPASFGGKEQARQAAVAHAARIRQGMPVRKRVPPEHTSKDPGVYWVKGQQTWRADAKNRNDNKRRTVTVSPADYDGDIERARQAAEEYAEQIRAGTYVRARAQHESPISGVTWDTAQQRWRVDVKGPDDQKRQTALFASANYDGDIERARQAAEECAEQIRAGIYMHQPARAEHTSEIPGVLWETSQRRWRVNVKRPDGSKHPVVTFAASRYGGEIEQARQAAEECAEQIQAGTYV